MQTNFKKLALTSAIAAGLGGASLPSHAIVEAIGEAHLVPLVVYYTQTPTLPSTVQTRGDVNTIIELTIPNVVGWEDVANTFLAPNTSPTNPAAGPGAFVFPDEQPADDGFSAVHWYWFDNKSVHRLNRRVPVTPDDIVQINWREEAGGAFNGQPGYMVIGTEGARNGDAANFAFFADAHLLIARAPDNGPPDGRSFLFADETWTAKIPTLALVDGEDGVLGTPVSNVANPAEGITRDHVKYAGRIVDDVSPLVSGIRTNLNDDILDDAVIFDWTLSHRALPTLLVAWLDTNLGDAGRGIPVNVYDTNENSCSWSIDLPYELNLIYIPTISPNPVVDPPEFDPLNWAWSTVWDVNNLCLPRVGGDFVGENEAGMVRVELPEYLDEVNGVQGPESSMYAFSLKLDFVPAPFAFDGVGDREVLSAGKPNFINVGTVLGHDRGMFEF